MLGIQFGLLRYRPIFESGVGDRDRHDRHDDRHLSGATGTRREDRQIIDCFRCQVFHVHSFIFDSLCATAPSPREKSDETFLTACNKGNRRRLHAGYIFDRHSYLLEVSYYSLFAIYLFFFPPKIRHSFQEMCRVFFRQVFLSSLTFLGCF